MIFTHCGLLGDFMLTFPVASWYYKKTNEQIDFVLPNISPFNGVDELLSAQEFTKSITFVDFAVDHFGRGGQPFNLNPSDYGITGEFINFGYSGWETIYEWLPYSHAMEHGLGVDEDFILKVELDEQYSNKVVIAMPILHKEFDMNSEEMDKREWGTYHLLNYSPERSVTLDNSKSLYHNLKLCAGAKMIYCSDGGIAIALDLMKKDFTMFYKNRDIQPIAGFEKYFFRKDDLHRSIISVKDNLIPRSGKNW